MDAFSPPPPNHPPPGFSGFFVEFLDSTCKGNRYPTTIHVLAAAIVKLAPKELEGAIVAWQELRSYRPRLAWARAQLVHQRAAAQASAPVKSVASGSS